MNSRGFVLILASILIGSSGCESAGQIGTSCPDGEVSCGSACCQICSTNENCPQGQGCCDEGFCSSLCDPCEHGYVYCSEDDTCHDLNDDMANCGACGKICDERSDRCNSGLCTCGADKQPGNLCPEGQACMNGSCDENACDNCSQGCCVDDLCIPAGSEQQDMETCGIGGVPCFSCEGLGNRVDSCSSMGACACSTDPDGLVCDVDEICSDTGCCNPGCPGTCPGECGDACCNLSENNSSCPADCPVSCGDKKCDGDETNLSCPIDCPVTCGDGRCEGSESNSTCATDCPVRCGDGRCEGDETRSSCVQDCAVCGDGILEGAEDRYHCMADSIGISGLVGYWSFDNRHMDPSSGQVRDLSGNGNNGRIIGAVRFVDSPWGQAADFSGGSERIEIPDPDIELSNLYNFTISFWSRQRSAETTQGLLHMGGVWGAYSFRTWAGKAEIQPFFRTRTGQNTADFDSTTGNEPDLDGVTVPFDTYVHYVITYAGANGECKQYINGKPFPSWHGINRDSCPMGGMVSHGPSMLQISGGDGSVLNGFDGEIDELMVFNRALSESEVQMLSYSTAQQYACGDGTCDLYFDHGLRCPEDCMGMEVTGRLLEKQDYTVWFADASVKVRNSYSPPPYTISAAELRLARGETRVFQIPVTSSVTRSLPVSISTTDGFTANLYKVESINLEPPVGQGLLGTYDLYKIRGEIPDPLLPVEHGIDLESNRTSVLLVEITALETCPAGYSNEAVSLEIDGERIPVRVRVYDFSIPPQPALKTAFDSSHMIGGIDGDACAGRKGMDYHAVLNSPDHAQVIELLDLYNDDYARHRISPYRQTIYRNPTYDCESDTWDFAKMDTALEHFIDDLHMSSVMMINYWRQLDGSGHVVKKRICGLSYDQEGFTAKATVYFQTLEEHLRQKGWLEEAFISFDEPYDNPNDASDDFVLDEARAFMDLVKGTTQLLIGPVTYTPESFSEFWDNANLWIIDASLFNLTPTPTKDELIGRGDEIWWYYTSGSQFDIDSAGIDHIAFIWSAWQHRVSGLLTWAGLIWDSHCCSSSATENPWTNPQTCWGPGQLYFYYPPCPENPGAICSSPSFRTIPSLRLKLFREGIQDYDYFVLLSREIEAAEARGEDTTAAHHALERVGEIVHSATTWERDPNLLVEIRRQVAEQIEALAQ